MLLITKKYVWCNGNISTTVRLSYHRITLTNWAVKYSMAQHNELSNDMELFGRDCNTHIYHISTLVMISMYWKCFIIRLYISDNIDCNVTVLYGTNVWNIIKYITVNKRLMTEKCWCLFMNHTSKKAKNVLVFCEKIRLFQYDHNTFWYK